METDIDIILSSFGFERKKLPQDGSCLFRAIAECVYHTQTKHKLVRREICDFLTKHKSSFKSYIEEKFEQYVANMKKPQVWGGQIEVECASRLYKSAIIVYSAKGIEAEHHPEFPDKIFLSYVNGNHYDILYSQSFFKSMKMSQNIIYDVLEHQILNREYKNIELDLWLSGEDQIAKIEKVEIIHIPIQQVEGTWGQSSELVKIKDKDYKEKSVEKVIIEIPLELQEKKDVTPKIVKPTTKVVPKKETVVQYPQIDCKDFNTLFETFRKFRELVILSNGGKTIGYVIQKHKNPLTWTMINCFGKTRHKKGENLSLRDLYEVFGKFLYSRCSQLKISEDDPEPSFVQPE
jgi:hypothetical protein